MATKEEKAEIERRFEEEWEKNWWARYALTWGNPDATDGTPGGHTEELVMLCKLRDYIDLVDRSYILDLLFTMSAEEREATNYLCGRVNGKTMIQYYPGVDWKVSRAQDIDHRNFEIDHQVGDSRVSNPSMMTGSPISLISSADIDQMEYQDRNRHVPIRRGPLSPGLRH